MSEVKSLKKSLKKKESKVSALKMQLKKVKAKLKKAK